MFKKFVWLCTLVLVLTLMCSLVVLGARDDDDDDDDYEDDWNTQRIELSENRVVLYLEDDKDERTWQIEAEGDPYDEEFKYSSSKSSVATVSNDGLITAKKVGQCTITVTGKESKKTAQVAVEVKDKIIPVEEVKVLNDGEVTVVKGKSKKLPFQILPSNYTSVRYSSSVSDSSICSVDTDGNVRGNNEGETTVYLFFNNIDKEDTSTSYNIEKDDAEFVMKFYVTVIDYNTERLDEFKEEFKGFTQISKKEDEEFVWLEVKDVGNILFDATTEKYCNGWVDVGRRRYYFEPKECTSTDSDGKIVKATFNVMKTGWFKDRENWYYLNTDGAMSTGWNRVGGKWYYLDPANGQMQTGRLSIGVQAYWLLDDGAAVELWYTDSNGVTYYGNPQTCELATGWFLVDGKWYYADPVNHNVLKNEWVYDEGLYYYMTEGGEMLVNGTAPDGNVVDANGVWVR